MRPSVTSVVRYRRPVEEGGDLAIMELLADGVAVFWCQEFGDVRWFEFIPGEKERDAVIRMVAEADLRGPLKPAASTAGAFEASVGHMLDR